MSYGINVVQIIAQVINIGLITLYVALIILAIRQWRHVRLTNLQRFGWAVLIIFMPIVGAGAFLAFNPSQPTNE